MSNDEIIELFSEFLRIAKNVVKVCEKIDSFPKEEQLKLTSDERFKIIQKKLDKVLKKF